MKPELQVVIQGSEVRFIHDDDLAEALKGLGSAMTRRASHVEPCDGGWKADLGPVGGPILGPFARHDQALEAETRWLQDNRTPAPFQ